MKSQYVEFDVGDKVWYKGEASDGEYVKWMLFEVVEVLDGDQVIPKYLLRCTPHEDPYMRQHHDFTVVSTSSFSRPLPDTRAVRRLVREWNDCFKALGEASEAIEEYWINRQVRKPRRTESCKK